MARMEKMEASGTIEKTAQTVSTAPMVKTGMMVMLAPTGVEILLMLLAVNHLMLALPDVEVLCSC